MRKLVKNTIFVFLDIFGGKNFSDRQYESIDLFKYFFWQKILRINAKVSWPVHKTSKIKGQKNIIKGTRNPGMSPGCYIDGRNGIHFGKNVWIGPKVSIISMNHDLVQYEKYISEEPICIGNNCWIGAQAIILPGVELGNHVIVGAGAVVTKSFKKDNVVIAGNPARIIKEISAYKQKNEKI